MVWHRTHLDRSGRRDLGTLLPWCVLERTCHAQRGPSTHPDRALCVHPAPNLYRDAAGLRRRGLGCWRVAWSSCRSSAAGRSLAQGSARGTISYTGIRRDVCDLPAEHRLSLPSIARPVENGHSRRRLIESFLLVVVLWGCTFHFDSLQSSLCVHSSLSLRAVRRPLISTGTR